MEQNRDSRNKPTYALPVNHFYNDTKNIKRGKNSLFNKWCWKNDIYKQRMKLGPIFHKTKKINSKWVKNLNMRPKIIKFIEESNRR